MTVALRSMSLEPMALELNLPWQQDEQREQAFSRILKRIFIPVLLLFLIVPWLPKIESGFIVEDDAPVRTQILLDPIAEPEPEPVAPEPEPRVEPEPEPVAPAPTPTTTPEPETQVQSAPAPATEVDPRQSLAESQGMSELSSQLNALRGSVNVASLQNKNLSDDESGEVARTERSRLGQDLSTRSAGTVVDETVMSSEITALSAHESASVEGVEMNDLPAGGRQGQGSNRTGQRDMESIRRTLEQAKGNVYALYQRALAEDPSLTGEFTFKLVIEPNGSISELKLLVSELGIPDLEQRILERIKNVKFSEMAVPPTVVEYRFVFLPS